MMAQPAKLGRRDLKRFGWQGIGLTIPKGWELVSTRGDYRTGYAGLADDKNVRLEMRWDSAQGTAEPSDAAARHIQALRKEAKKDQTDIAVRRDVKLVSLQGKEIECYEWRAGTQGAGMVSRCDECHRMVHLVVLGDSAEPLRGLSRTIFSSLQDHPEGGGLLWRFYDVAFCSPADLPLQQHELKTGCIRMFFGRARRRLEFARVSIASVVLGQQGLGEWFKGFYGPSLKRWRYKIDEAPSKGHSGVRLAGEAWLVADPGCLLGKRREIRVACWHCEPSNRLFIVRHSAPRGEESVFEQAVSDVQCCPEQ